MIVKVNIIIFFYYIKGWNSMTDNQIYFVVKAASLYKNKLKFLSGKASENKSTSRVYSHVTRINNVSEIIN